MRAILCAVIRLSENAKKEHSNFYHAPWFVEYLRFLRFEGLEYEMSPAAVPIWDLGSRMSDLKESHGARFRQDCLG
jgi:hypothetical protein